jgi:hypothetical protein
MSTVIDFKEFDHLDLTKLEDGSFKAVNKTTGNTATGPTAFIAGTHVLNMDAHGNKNCTNCFNCYACNDCSDCAYCHNSTGLTNCFMVHSTNHAQGIAYVTYGRQRDWKG